MAKGKIKWQRKITVVMELRKRQRKRKGKRKRKRKRKKEEKGEQKGSQAKEEMAKELKDLKEVGKAAGLIIHNVNATIAKDGVTYSELPTTPESSRSRKRSERSSDSRPRNAHVSRRDK